MFLDHVMIRERGLFTLLGSKPMTEFDVEIGIGETAEDRKKDYLTMLNGREEPADSLTYEEFITEWEKTPHLNHKGQWYHWKNNQIKLVGDQYFFLTRKSPYGDGSMGLFINVPETIYLLNKYYSSFFKITGIAYQPETILEEISNNNSPFWERVFLNHFLFGLLMGYGEKNAFIYHLLHKSNPNNAPDFPYLARVDHDADKDLFFGKKVTVKDLSVPHFGSYSIYDETLERYRKEKEEILKFFHKNEFASTVLDILKLKTTSE